MTDAPHDEERIFTWGAPPLKFGAGAADKIGVDLAGFGVRRVLVVTDPGVAALGAPSRIADALRRQGIKAEIFDDAHGGRHRGDPDAVGGQLVAPPPPPARGDRTSEP